MIYDLLFAAAVALYGWGADLPTPAIYYMDQEKLCLQAGYPKALVDSCSINSYYNHKTKKIYSKPKATYQNDLVHDSFIVHEFVHYLQDAQHKLDPNDCVNRIQNELQAYMLQNQFLLRHGKQLEGIPRLGC